MKQTLDNLKRKAAAAPVRAAAATAAALPLAVFLGGVRLNNHNETLVRDRLS